jgi:hypothetical protein
MRTLLVFSASVSLLASASAAHKPLLPRPQKISYGDGSLPVESLWIRLADSSPPEDQFAADQLAAGLTAISRIPITVRRSRGTVNPITLTRTGAGAPVPGDNETVGPDSRESYSLQVTTKGVEIRAPSSAGLFYGVQTLLQMVEGSGHDAVLPAAEVRDWPALAYRGFMMDFSHGQLLRATEVERQIDLLARFKANQYYFYSEASIEFQGYELLNPDGRFSRGEIKHLIEYAHERHIEVVPCMELFGHMHDLFRVEKFADLGLPRYGDEFDPRNPRVLPALDGWIEQTANLFPGPWYHVGFDEPWSLGKIGVEAGKDPFKTFVEVLGHVAAQAKLRGKRLMFWADIDQGASTLSDHPELIHQLPRGTIAVPWIYDIRTNYTRYIEPLAKENIPIVVAPGIWNWNEIFPDYHRSFININGLVAAGKEFKTLGVFTTGWTDSAQTLYRQSLPGLALGAAAGWQSGPVDTNSFFADYCALMYAPAVAAQVAPALEELSKVEEMFQSILQNTTQHGFWGDPLEATRLARLEAKQSELRQARLLAETAQERLLRARSLAPADPTLNSLLLASRIFDYLGMKSLYAVEWAGYFRQLKENPDPKLVTLFIGIQMNAQNHGMLADLIDTSSGLGELYREAWLQESRPYRLTSALARWDAETEYWRATWHRVNNLLRNRNKDEPFPSIDAIRAKH